MKLEDLKKQIDDQMEKLTKTEIGVVSEFYRMNNQMKQGVDKKEKFDTFEVTVTGIKQILKQLVKTTELQTRTYEKLLELATTMTFRIIENREQQTKKQIKD